MRARHLSPRSRTIMAALHTRELSEPPTLLSLLDDDLNQALARVSIAHHGTVAIVCVLTLARFRDLVMSDEFQLVRRSAGCAEPSVMVLRRRGWKRGTRASQHALLSSLSSGTRGSSSRQASTASPTTRCSSSQIRGFSRAPRMVMSTRASNFSRRWAGKAFASRSTITVIGEDLFVGGGYFCGNFGACSELLHVQLSRAFVAEGGRVSGPAIRGLPKHLRAHDSGCR